MNIKNISQNRGRGSYPDLSPPSWFILLWVTVLYNLFELMGQEVMVVNAAHMKAVPGRKTDVTDAEWIAELLQPTALSDPSAYLSTAGRFVAPPSRWLFIAKKKCLSAAQDQAFPMLYT